jgi:hypothetical protein
MTRIVRIVAGDASAVWPLASSSSLVSSLIPPEHPSEAAAAAAAAAADAAAAAAAAAYINGGGFFKPISSNESSGCREWQLVDHQQHRQRLSFHTGWARGLRVVPVLKDIYGGDGGGGGGGGGGGSTGEFEDGSEEFVAVVWNDLAIDRHVLLLKANRNIVVVFNMMV